MLWCAAAVLGVLLPGEPKSPGDKIPVLIVTGANNHDWQYTSESFKTALEDSGRFLVEVTTEPGKTLADAGALRKYAAFLLDYNGPRWGDEAERCFLAAARSGTGVAVFHAANNAFPGWREYEELVGLCWREGTGHGAFHEFDVKILDRSHPITRALSDFKAHPDELYHRLVHMHGARFEVIASAFSTADSGGSGRDEPMMTVRQFGVGRVFHTPLGHVWPGVEDTRRSHQDPQFRTLVVRALEWVASGRVSGDPPPANQLTEEERGAGFRSLFDGVSNRGWRGFRSGAFPGNGWVVEDGALRCIGGKGGGDIITSDRFEDFELSIEWKVAKGSNSGIIYRVSEEEETTWLTGPEYQVLDDGAEAADSSTSAGALYALYGPAGKTLKPVGEYNLARIVVEGDHVEHWLNGVKVVDVTMHGEDWKERVKNSKFGEMPRFGTVKSGHIALQDHGNDVWYRNIRLRVIKPKVELSTSR